MNYILDGHKAVEEPDIIKWATWHASANRVVAQTTGDVSLHGEKVGQVRISTVFLAIDHAFDGGEPLLFETMVFGGTLDQEMDRCGTWEAAEKMHELMCERVRTSVA